jgi:hypothetical protein
MLVAVIPIIIKIIIVYMVSINSVSITKIIIWYSQEEIFLLYNDQVDWLVKLPGKSTMPIYLESKVWYSCEYQL